jgi:hypothetical protein
LHIFTPDDVYNQDETGIFWRQLPTRSLATMKRAGGKKIKERVTVSLTCNFTGNDKRPLLLIGKAKRPRSFPKSFQPKRDMNVHYANNKAAWMTTAEFNKWVLDWNASLLRYRSKVTNRNRLLNESITAWLT